MNPPDALLTPPEQMSRVELPSTAPQHTTTVFPKDESWPVVADMGKYLTALLSAFPGAFVTGILWYWIDSATGGMLARAPFPLNNVFACVAIGVVTGVGGHCVAIFVADRRRQRLETVAGWLGMDFAEEVSRKSLEVSGRLYLFDDWLEATHLIAGEFDGVAVQSFDLWTQYTSRSHNSNRQTHNQKQTVFLLPLPAESDVSVQVLQKGVVGWMLGAIGFDGIEFQLDDAFASEEDRRTLEEFNDAYLVVQGLSRGGANLGSVSAPAENSESVLSALEQRLSLDFLRQLLQGRGYSLEVCGSHVAFWRHKKRVAPNALQAAFSEVVALYRLLVDTPADQDRLKLTASGQTSLQPELSAGRFGVILGGGCLGMVLAFALFIPIFFMFVDQAPWLVFAWPIFGGAVIAATIFVTSRVARKWRKRPQTTAEQRTLITFGLPRRSEVCRGCQRCLYLLQDKYDVF